MHTMTQQVHLTAMRMLGQDQADHTQATGTQDHVDSSLSHTRNLRIAAVFIILAAGLVGGLPPLWLQAFRKPGHALPRILRSFAAGIILALALIHIMPDAIGDLADLTQFMKPGYEYNPAGACAAFGIILMVSIESSTHFLIHRQAAKRAARKCEEDSSAHHHHHHHHYCDQPIAESTGDYLADPHTHVCMGPGHIILNAVQTASVRDQVIAAMFELGCVFHSFIIGFALGVNDTHGDSSTTSPVATVRGLIIALSFHQWLEGISLGSFIMRAHLSKWKGIIMVIVYSVTCPLGIAIGIRVSSSYDPESITAKAVSGTFNGVSAGMLLYIGLVQLVAEDFSRRELTSCPKDANSSRSHSPKTVSPKAVVGITIVHGNGADLDGADLAYQHLENGSHHGSSHCHTSHRHHHHKHIHAEEPHHTGGHAGDSHTSHNHNHSHSHHNHSHHNHSHHNHSHSHDHMAHSHDPGCSHEHAAEDQPWVFVACHGALFLGAALMGVLAIWA